MDKPIDWGEPFPFCDDIYDIFIVSKEENYITFNIIMKPHNKIHQLHKIPNHRMEKIEFNVKEKKMS